MEIEIYFEDLSLNTQMRIASQLRKQRAELIKERNWDIIPIDVLVLENEN